MPQWLRNSRALRENTTQCQGDLGKIQTEKIRLIRGTNSVPVKEGEIRPGMAVRFFNFSSTRPHSHAVLERI